MKTVVSTVSASGVLKLGTGGFAGSRKRAMDVDFTRNENDIIYLNVRYLPNQNEPVVPAAKMSVTVSRKTV